MFPISACGPGFLLLQLMGAPSPLWVLSRAPGHCRAMGHLLAEVDGRRGWDVPRQAVVGREQLVLVPDGCPCQALRGIPRCGL